jgi:hypothetical protein
LANLEEKSSGWPVIGWSKCIGDSNGKIMKVDRVETMTRDDITDTMQIGVRRSERREAPGTLPRIISHRTFSGALVAVSQWKISIGCRPSVIVNAFSGRERGLFPQHDIRKSARRGPLTPLMNQLYKELHSSV